MAYADHWTINDDLSELRLAKHFENILRYIRNSFFIAQSCAIIWISFKLLNKRSKLFVMRKFVYETHQS